MIRSGRRSSGSPRQRWTLSSFEPQPYAIPSAAEESGLGHVGERDHRELRERAAFERNLDRTDTLAVRDRCDQRLGRRHRELERSGLAFRQRKVLVSKKAGGDIVRRAFPYPQRLHRLAGLIELHGIECL